MKKTLGIYVNSDQHWKHLLGIVKAAVAKGIQINLFFTYKGVLITKQPEFRELADAVNGHGKMSLCLHSWNELNLGDDHTIPGISENDFATQVRHAELIDEMDRYLVL